MRTINRPSANTYTHKYRKELFLAESINTIKLCSTYSTASKYSDSRFLLVKLVL